MNLEAGILLLITNDYSVSVVELSIVLNFALSVDLLKDTTFWPVSFSAPQISHIDLETVFGRGVSATPAYSCPVGGC